MTNEEKARDICSLFNEVYGVNIERESYIYSAAINMAKWKDENDCIEINGGLFPLFSKLWAELI